MQKIVCNDVEECECNLGYYANFEHNDKKYCSRCYQIKTGKLLFNFKSLPDDINEIQETLNSVFNYNNKKNKALLMLFKNCKIDSDFKSLFDKIYNQENIFILAKEAEAIISIINSSMISKDFKISLQHLTCARVIDYWNMTVKSHNVGPCYYGNFGEEPNNINEGILFVKRNVDSNIKVFNNEFIKSIFNI